MTTRLLGVNEGKVPSVNIMLPIKLCGRICKTQPTADYLIVIVECTLTSE